MIFDLLKSSHPLLDLPIRPHRLDAIGSSLFNNNVYRQLLSALPPLIGFESVLDRCNGSHSLEKSIEEQNHLLVFMDVHSPVIVKHIEANGNHDVQVRRLEHQEIFVLVLENELVDEWILLKAIKSFLKLFHVEVA